jgi:hypothetical protein
MAIRTWIAFFKSCGFINATIDLFMEGKLKRRLLKTLAWLNIAAGLFCLIAWGLNSAGWISFGNPTAQLILAPVCAALGIMLLKIKVEPE